MTETRIMDLRVRKTREAIRRTFEEMILEMDFEDITVKELAKRARINRRTFYLHYETLDCLLSELKGELTQKYIERTRELERPRDMDKLTREFFLYSEELGELGERITCSGTYRGISRELTNDIMEQTWEKDRPRPEQDPYRRRVVMEFVSQGTLAVYRQWVAEGKKVPIEQIIEITAALVCRGLEGIAGLKRGS